MYILGSSYLTGFVVLSGMGHIFGKEEGRVFRPDSYVMAGLVALTVYAQLFSLFHKVGLSANLLLAGICILSAIIFRRKLWGELKRQMDCIPKGRKVFCLFLFLLFEYCFKYVSKLIFLLLMGVFFLCRLKCQKENGSVSPTVTQTVQLS